MLFVAHAIYIPSLVANIYGPIQALNNSKANDVKFKEDITFFESIFKISRLFYYTLTMIIVQDVYYFTKEDDCKEEDDVKARTWFYIEIVTFYMNMVGSVLFIGLSKCFIGKSGLEAKIPGKEMDYLALHSELGSIFTRCYMGFVLTGALIFKNSARKIA